jgi:hypothetical protein
MSQMPTPRMISPVTTMQMMQLQRCVRAIGHQQEEITDLRHHWAVIDALDILLIGRY